MALTVEAGTGQPPHALVGGHVPVDGRVEPLGQRLLASTEDQENSVAGDPGDLGALEL